jgi:hypothetical protein
MGRRQYGMKRFDHKQQQVEMSPQCVIRIWCVVARCSVEMGTKRLAACIPRFILTARNTYLCDKLQAAAVYLSLMHVKMPARGWNFLIGNGRGVLLALLCLIVWYNTWSGKAEHGFEPDAIPLGELSSNTEKAQGKEFVRVAQRQRKVSDKINHGYAPMYGTFLGRRRTEKLKFLEIGLGCDMSYGPGASLALWKEYLPSSELWFAEFDAKCVQRGSAEGMFEGVNIVVGDQGNRSVLLDWVRTSGGDFDVIVDDGGHKNSQIWASLTVMWENMKPGGIYFIEDIHVGRAVDLGWEDTRGEYIMLNVLIAWMDQLVIPSFERDRLTQGSSGKIAEVMRDLVRRYPVPKGLKRVSCQQHACILEKCNESEEDKRLLTCV